MGKRMSNETLSVTVEAVRLSDGALDVARVLELVRAQLESNEANNADANVRIEAAVHDLFDQHLGQGIPMPDVQMLVFQNLGLTLPATNISDFIDGWKGRIGNFIRSQAGEQESGAVFGVTKGRGGGVKRWRDVPALEPKKGKKSA